MKEANEEKLRQHIADFYNSDFNSKGGNLWNSLTEEQKLEVYLSYLESQDDNNLIDWKDVKDKP